MNTQISIVNSNRKELFKKIDILEEMEPEQISALILDSTSQVLNLISREDDRIDGDLLELLSKKISTEEIIYILDTYLSEVIKNDIQPKDIIRELLNSELIETNIANILFEYAKKHYDVCWALFFEKKPTIDKNGNIVFLNAIDKNIFEAMYRATNNEQEWERLIYDSIKDENTYTYEEAIILIFPQEEEKKEDKVNLIESTNKGTNSTTDKLSDYL